MGGATEESGAAKCVLCDVKKESHRLGGLNFWQNVTTEKLASS